jgi:voltage-dependent calcium channel L type alpha-1D
MVIFYILFMIVGALFVMNMFVGVVVDTFNTQKSK